MSSDKPRHTSISRRTVLAGMGIATASGLLASAGSVLADDDGEESSTLSESPPGKALVVDANLQEAFRKPDVAYPQDMRNFARRLVSKVPYAPDILLLQEVRKKSTHNVAQFMSEETNYTYEVAVEPPVHPWVPEGAKNDTGIVYNTDTMHIEDDGGFMRTTSGKGGKDHAYALLKENRGGLRVPALSVHWPHGSDVIQRAKKTASFLLDEYPSPSNWHVPVVAGDFNVKRCHGGDSWKWEARDCEPNEWYSLFTQKYDYSDVVLTANPQEIPRAQELGRARIDFIFAQGKVFDGASDLGWKAEFESREAFKECKKLHTKPDKTDEEPTGFCNTAFYTDHRFVWGLVGSPEDEDDG